MTTILDAAEALGLPDCSDDCTCRGQVRLEEGTHQWDWASVPARCVWCRAVQVTGVDPVCRRYWLEEGGEPHADLRPRAPSRRSRPALRSRLLRLGRPRPA